MATIEGDGIVNTEHSPKRMLTFLPSFPNRLPSTLDLFARTRDIEEQIELAEERVLRRGNSISDPFLDWEHSPDESSDYLQAVDDLLRLTKTLSLAEQDGDTVELLERSQTALKLAMSHLQDEFRQILARNAVPLNVERLYGSIHRVSLSLSLDGEGLIPRDDDSGSEDGEGKDEFRCRRISGIESSGRESKGDHGYSRVYGSGSRIGSLIFDLVSPNAIPNLRDIADRMVRSNYGKECCWVYSRVRRVVLDECLSILGVDKVVGAEEAQMIKWEVLDQKMKKWAMAIKIVVQVVLVAEKRLCDQIFVGSEMESIREPCFTQTAKGSMRHLLNFAEGIAICQRSPEKLFRILDMYDGLAGVMTDLKMLFVEEPGEIIYSEAYRVLARLGEAAVGTFEEFENAVQSESSKTPIQGGEIHPLTRYVMNYAKLLVAFSDTLNLLLGDNQGDHQNQFFDSEEDDNDIKYTGSMSPVALRLSALMSSLESKLEEKSKLYECNSMQYIFLMNNIHYIVQKVKDSELGVLLGDHWVRKRRGQIRKHSTSYLRASWSKVLICLKDEGLGSGGSSLSFLLKMALKERFKSFNSGFEEIYRNQTAWKVRDPQLREELCLSISENFIRAYRSFMGKFGGHLEGERHPDKYLKYTPEDLEELLLDLFQGSPRTLNNPRRKLGS